jgi:hypothetical protein
MKDRKSLYLLIFALIVITIALTLISVWGYRFYFSNKVPESMHLSNVNAFAVRKTNAETDRILLDSAIQRLNNPADTITYDSSDHQLAFKILQFNRIKNDIAFILKNRISAKDSSSGTKIAELEKIIDELRNQNMEISKENVRLNEMVRQLSGNKENMKDEKAVFSKNKEQSASNLPLLVSHLRFVAYTNEKKTVLASETKKLQGSFEINVKSQNAVKEIYVVIVQPDGKVLLGGSGTSATFETASGRKFYTAVVHFDTEKDNHTRLQFSVNSGAFRKGQYIMQIYHEGIMIGRLKKWLY